MRVPSRWVFAGASSLLLLTGAVLAETKVVVKDVHLCCGACVKGVGAALKGVDGVKPACDQQEKTITITATDDATAQKAIDALAAAGYHGTPDNAAVKFKDEPNVPAGKVKSISLVNVHNCCGACCKAIKATVKKVDGVAGDTAKPKNKDFDVTGDFDAAAVVKALNDAGFHVQVK